MKHLRGVPVIAILGICLALATGCSPKWKAEIESDTSWYAIYGGVSGNNWASAEMSGSGDRTIDLPNDDRVCILVQQTGAGRVHVTLKDTGGGLFHLLADDDRSASTNVNGGVVDMCSEGTLPPDSKTPRRPQH